MPPTGLRWALYLFLSHARRSHKHTSFQNATQASVRRERRHKLFNRNIIPMVHSHLIVIPKADIGTRGGCMESMRAVLQATNRFRTLVYSHTEKCQYNTPMKVHMNDPAQVSCYHQWLICTIRHYLRCGEGDIQAGVQYKQTYTNTQTSPEERVSV